MMRGDLVTIAMQGDFGKPRPALVIQANPFSEHTSVAVLPITSTIVAAPLLRVTVSSGMENGLKDPSQIMVDKIMTVKRSKVGAIFGHIDANTLVEVERCLAVFLGIAK
jgi:hypothetical protein